MVFAIFLRNKEGEDYIVSYCKKKEDAERIIPPKAADKYFMKEIPDEQFESNANQAVPVETRKLKTVVENPLENRNFHQMVRPINVENYLIKFTSKSVKKETISLDIFDIEKDFEEKKISLTKIKIDLSSKDSLPSKKGNYKARHFYSSALKKEECIIKNKEKKPSYQKYEIDGKNMFRWSFMFLEPTLDPDINYTHTDSVQEESISAIFVRGDYRPDRNFSIVCYSKTKEKAETLVYKKLTSLIESWI